MDTRTGHCHCRAVHFEAALGEGFDSVTRCNCSYCRMRGAAFVNLGPGYIKILRGEDALTLYRFNTGVAEHYFCSHCGIYTHHKKRSDPNSYSVNVGCLDGVSPLDFSEVPVMDGVHHPKDTGRPAQLAGTFVFVPAEPGTRDM